MAAAACLASLAAAAAQGPELTVTANRDQIYLGESILLTLKVSGTDSAQPDLSGIRNCNVKFLGSQGDSRRSITFINGRLQQESFVGRTYAYELTPLAQGTFQAGPVLVAAEGQTLTAPGPTVEVQGVESQDRVIVSVEATRDAVLVDEPFDVTLSILVKRMQGRFSDIDPMNPSEPPQLNVGYLDGQPIKGLDCPDIKALLQGILVEQPDAAGFAINSYTVQRDPFRNMFNFDIRDMARESPAKFRLSRRPVQRNGSSYFEYTLVTRYVAREEGSHTFGPAVFKGSVVLGVNERGQPFVRPIFAVGPAFTVRVVPPPEEGRPPSFVGAIGSNMAVKASLDTQTCNVGDPLTLTLEISGAIGKENLYPPVLSRMPQLTNDFRVYDDTVQGTGSGDARVYSYTIRPVRAGTLEVPPLEVAFFNSTRAAYETVRTDPIPLRVNESTEMNRSMIIQTMTNRPPGQAVELRGRDQFAAPMTMHSHGAEQDSLLDAGVNGLVAAAGPACWLAVTAAAAMRRRLRAGAGDRRRRGALRRASRLLAEADRRADSDPAGARRDLCAAIRSYVADRFAVAADSVTPGDARRLLQAACRGGGAAEALCDILERSFNAAYGMPGGAGPAGEDIGRARRLLAEIDDEILRAGAARESEEAVR